MNISCINQKTIKLGNDSAKIFLEKKKGIFYLSI